MAAEGTKKEDEAIRVEMTDPTHLTDDSSVDEDNIKIKAIVVININIADLIKISIIFITGEMF